MVGAEVHVQWLGEGLISPPSARESTYGGATPDLGSAVCMGCNNLERAQWGVGLGSVVGDV